MDNDGSVGDVLSQDRDKDNDVTKEHQQDPDNHMQQASDLASSASDDSTSKQVHSIAIDSPDIIQQETKRQRSISPPPSPTTSDEEDVALLEEISRIKAELEAKIQAKRQKKTMASAVEKYPNCKSNALSTGSASPDTRQSLSPTLPEEDPFVYTTSTTTTPPTKRTPLSSPGLRTPSPPARFKSLVSPSSGATARKRQHSPSPLPRRSPRGLTSTPRKDHTTISSPSFGPNRFQRRLNDSVESDAPSDMKEKATKTVTELEQDIENDFDDALLESILDLDDNDDLLQKNESTTISDIVLSPRLKNLIKSTSTLSPSKRRTSQLDSSSTAPTDNFTIEPTNLRMPDARATNLTDTVIAQQQERAAAQVAQHKSRVTFMTIGNDTHPVSGREAARHGHTAQLDPLSGARLKTRITSCEDVTRMTRNICNIPLKDTDSIRARMERRGRAGLLPSSSSANTSYSETVIAQEPESTKSNQSHWMIAGVVGAKSQLKTTAKMAQYFNFQLSDLRSAAVNVFLFRDVMKRHYEGLRLGDVVAVMNPKVLNQAEHTGTLGVQVEHPDCLLVIGTSIDFGLCEAVKLNGASCNKPIDKRASSYCNHHIMMIANKGRNQRGSLIAGTSSIYDLDKSALRPFKPFGQHKTGARGLQNSSNSIIQSVGKEPQETTYFFDDGGVGTSLLADPKKTKKGTNQVDDELSAFLMTQNNPGGHYLRQAKESKDVTWAKDVSSPKTPTKNSELFPAEMVRRMGYDPVTGQFVPGSPKRINEDPEARERSLRLLAERVRSPPSSPLSSLSPNGHRQTTLVVKGMTRAIAQPKSKGATALRKTSGKEVTGDVFFRDRGVAVPSAGSLSTADSKKKWVDLDGSSASESEMDADGNPILSLSQQPMPKTGAIGHVALSASDYEVSKKYYNLILVDILGYKLLTEHPFYTMWSHPLGVEIILSPGNKTPHHKTNPGLHHLAFYVETKEEVESAYQKILKFHEDNKELTGCTILDKPAPYPQYGEGYYAVFFTDPDNIKLELAYVPPN
ncbi:hypothetical protein FBU30_007033 [Linnemannia zychae]|nr:hypothetical protein FBU30_007033 [Linnemannia zychae]